MHLLLGAERGSGGGWQALHCELADIMLGAGPTRFVESLVRFTHMAAAFFLLQSLRLALPCAAQDFTDSTRLMTAASVVLASSGASRAGPGIEAFATQCRSQARTLPAAVPLPQARPVVLDESPLSMKQVRNETAHC